MQREFNPVSVTSCTWLQLTLCVSVVTDYSVGKSDVAKREMWVIVLTIK